MYQTFKHNYHNQELPNQPVVIHPKSLAKVIFSRIMANSALSQHEGYFCDVIVCPKQSDIGYYYQALPIDYVHKSELGQNEHYYTIAMTSEIEIKQGYPDSFTLNNTCKDNINFDPAVLYPNPNIHPIIRRFYKDKLFSEFHISENFTDECKNCINFQSLINFFCLQLSLFHQNHTKYN